MENGKSSLELTKPNTKTTKKTTEQTLVSSEAVKETEIGSRPPGKFSAPVNDGIRLREVSYYRDYLPEFKGDDRMSKYVSPSSSNVSCKETSTTEGLRQERKRPRLDTILEASVEMDDGESIGMLLNHPDPEKTAPELVLSDSTGKISEKGKGRRTLGPTISQVQTNRQERLRRTLVFLKEREALEHTILAAQARVDAINLELHLGMM